MPATIYRPSIVVGDSITGATQKYDGPYFAMQWLLRHQAEDGGWLERDFTGTGFPRVFYLRYHGYAAIFPLWALARLRNLRRGNSGRVAFGL